MVNDLSTLKSQKKRMKTMKGCIMLKGSIGKKHKMNIFSFFVLIVVFSSIFSSSFCFADNSLAEISEIFVSSIHNAPTGDLWVKVVWTGDGDKEAGISDTLLIQQSTFGENGVSRLQSLFLAALLSGKVVWIVYDDANLVTAAYLKNYGN